MPDNLRVTVPITPNDSVGRIHPQKESSVVEALTPDRVTPPNQRDRANQGNSFDTLMGRDSVFSQFIQQLRQTPALSETLQKAMFDIFNRREDLRTGGAVNTLLRELADGMQMDKAELLKNLVYQQENATKFSGKLFDALRSMQKNLKGTDFDLHLADFLKAYDGFFSIQDTTDAIARQMNRLWQQIPRSLAKPMQEAAQELDVEQPVQQQPKNLALLKERIIPMLGDYVSRTNDFGRARSTITLLVHDIARLNMSSESALVEKFETLVDFCRYGLNLPQEQTEALRTLLAQEIAKQNSGHQNQFMDSVLKLLQDSSAQQKLSTSGTGAAAFRDAANALLLDQSVYMPFTHIFLPANFEGQFLFSELWVEKEPQEHAKNTEQEEAPRRLFLKFDIKNVGSFEAAFSISGSSINMQLSCPPALPENRRTVSDNIHRILEQNGLTVNGLHVSSGHPLNIQKQIQQTIAERKEFIDVTI